jgi:nucleoside phosphorylase
MTCIVTAADIEFNTASGLLSKRTYTFEAEMPVCRGFYDDRQLTILKSEIGARGFTNRLSTHLRNNKYQALVVAGLAGALEPKLMKGDVVVFDSCHNARADVNGAAHNVVTCNDELSQAIAERLVESGLRCSRGAGVTVDRIITSAREKIALGTRYKAAAVDMESYESLAVCADFGLSATALRIISDDAGCDLPDFNRALTPAGRMNNWRLATAMMMSPIDSLRFMLSIKAVMYSLQANLKIIFGAI